VYGFVTEKKLTRTKTIRTNLADKITELIQVA